MESIRPSACPQRLTVGTESSILDSGAFVTLVKALLAVPRHESTSGGPSNTALLHHLSESRLRCGTADLARELGPFDGQRQRWHQRGHHPFIQALVFSAVPPRGQQLPWFIILFHPTLGKSFATCLVFLI